MYWIFSSGICTGFPSKQCLITQQSLCPVIVGYIPIKSHKIPSIHHGKSRQPPTKNNPTCKASGPQAPHKRVPRDWRCSEPKWQQSDNGPEIRFRKRPKLWWKHWKPILKGFFPKHHFRLAGPCCDGLRISWSHLYRGLQSPWSNSLDWSLGCFLQPRSANYIRTESSYWDMLSTWFTLW